MDEINIVFIYDGADFPQVPAYADLWGIRCIDLRAKRRCKEIQPTSQNYTMIYFAVLDRAKYDDILSTHLDFPHEFVKIVPDYRGIDLDKKYKELYAKGCREIFDDLKIKPQEKSQEKKKKTKRIVDEELCASIEKEKANL